MNRYTGKHLDSLKLTFVTQITKTMRLDMRIQISENTKQRNWNALTIECKILFLSKTTVKQQYFKHFKPRRVKLSDIEKIFINTDLMFDHVSHHVSCMDINGDERTQDSTSKFWKLSSHNGCKFI